MSATAKEHVPNLSEIKNENNESKEMNGGKWFNPKKCTLVNCFVKTYETKGEWDKTDNEQVALADNDKIKEKEEDEIKVNNNESKMMKAKVVKKIKSS